MMKDNFEYLKKIGKYVQGHLFFWLCVLGLFYASISAVVPIISAKVVNAITSNVIKQLIYLAIILFIARLLEKVIEYFMDAIYYRFTKEIVTGIQQDMASAVLNLEVKNFDQNNSGTFVKRLDDDPYDIARIYNSIRNTLTNILTNIAVFFLIFTINVYVGLFFTVGLIFIYLIQKKRVIYYDKGWKEVNELDDYTSSIFQEMLKGARDIKVLGLKQPFMKHTTDSVNQSYTKRMKILTKNTLYYCLSDGIRDIFEFLFLLLGAYLTFNEKLTPANFIVLYMYKNQLFSLANYISNFAGDWAEFKIAAKRVFEVIDYTKFSKEKFGNKHIKGIVGNIEFKNVTFGYQEDMPILKNLNLKIPANDTIALVGKSGEGKTTIFSLLSRLYNVDKGDITIDGTSIYELDESTMRSNISVITQNPYIFNMTIKENLRLVNPNISDEEIIQKCKLACLHDYIESLPDKYDTLIGEGGINLSGGQKQRLAIARALVKDSEIILLDEATSALDNETQAEIQKSIMNISSDYTIIIIAHRLSTIEFCNRIVVISNGKINAIGTHEELLQNNDIYRELYQGKLE